MRTMTLQPANAVHVLNQLPAEDRLKDAALSEDPNAAANLANSHADDCMRGFISQHTSELATANIDAGLAREKLARIVAERQRINPVMLLRDQSPRYGKRQPFWQRFYNFAKCVVAAGAPLMGGGYLMSNMLDQSFAMSEAPYLAVLASGPILLASLALSSWATLPTDDRKVERRATVLLVLSGVAYVFWAALMSMRFGVVPPAPDALGTGFDPTQGNGGAASGLMLWLETNGISVGALFMHLVGEAFLAAACIASALCSGRKVLPIDAEQTSHDKLLEAKEDDARAEVSATAKRVVEAEASLANAEANRAKLHDLSLQAVKARREALKARQRQAMDNVTDLFHRQTAANA